MRITWYGHAAFLIETEGVRIILDPYRSPDCGGYEPVAEPADLVIVSHENDRYHSHLGQIVPPFETIRALELSPAGTRFRGVEIGAIRVYETPERLAGDEVAIVHLRSERLHLVFMGDLGHALTEPEVSPLRGADVVLVPAGGPPTINYPEIPPLLAAIRPRVVIPMHYKTPKIDLNIQPVERFLEVLPGVPVGRPGTSAIEIHRAMRPETMTIVRLEHAR
jgi:L-ascorbate metabolism protein UlaG (beta-lactamase superfamily)